MNDGSCSTASPRDFIDVSVHTREQTLVYFPGDGDPLFMGDDLDRANLLEYVRTPVARAVLAARLRAFADMLDHSSLDDMISARAVS